MSDEGDADYTTLEGTTGTTTNTRVTEYPPEGRDGYARDTASTKLGSTCTIDAAGRIPSTTVSGSVLLRV